MIKSSHQSLLSAIHKQAKNNGATQLLTLAKLKIADKMATIAKYDNEYIPKTLKSLLHCFSSLSVSFLMSFTSLICLNTSSLFPATRNANPKHAKN